MTAGIDAGDFADWLRVSLATLRGDSGADVPCGTCTACCTASQFVHIAPHETTTLRRINKKLLFPAPGLPRGHVLMGYDHNGHCPMFKDGRCSIYEDRPETCRVYDCRVFSATGITIDDPDKAEIEHRVRAWRFRYGSEVDSVRHDAIRAAASLLGSRPDLFDPDDRPRTQSQLAVVALLVHETFLTHSEGTVTTAVPDDAELRAAIVQARASANRRH